ncbi:MAG: hypothetical protein GY842_20270, partial [bacterium]|nr:hypothetical protein [bacterium]
MRRTRTSGWYSRLRGEQADPWRAHRLDGGCRMGLVAAVALVWLANPGLAADEPAVSLGRVETAQKGSLLILSAVELRWAEDGSLVQ